MPREQAHHLGYTAAETAESRYARFYRPDMNPLPAHVREAVLTGALAPELLPGLDQLSGLVAADELEVETGFTVCSDGETRIFERTEMPRVTPVMWDWWFAWHGSDAQRYKLWHPRAHVSAAWKDGLGELGHYVGRTSQVVEYIGAEKLEGSIRFVSPASLGVDEEELTTTGTAMICARVGPSAVPVDIGWLVHYVRPIPGGSEMRSFFWIGGRHIAARGAVSGFGPLIRGLARLFPKSTAVPATDLLVHCAQEMGHLAGILPELYAEFGQGERPSKEQQEAVR